MKELDGSVGCLHQHFRLIHQKSLQFFLIDKTDEENFAPQHSLHKPGILDQLALFFWTFGGVTVPPGGSLSNGYERKNTNQRLHFVDKKKKTASLGG